MLLQTGNCTACESPMFRMGAPYLLDTVASFSHVLRSLRWMWAPNQAGAALVQFPATSLHNRYFLVRQSAGLCVPAYLPACRHVHSTLQLSRKRLCHSLPSNLGT